MCAVVIHIVAATLVMATMTSVTGSEAAVAAAMWSFMPIVGALGASLMAFLLNRVSERRGAVAGRVICSMVFGVGIPRALTLTHPWVKTMALDPILLMIAGFLCGLLGYAAAVHVVDRAFKLAPGVIDKGVEQLAEVVSAKVVSKTAANVEAQPEIVEKAMDDLAEKTSQKTVDKLQAKADAATERLY